MGVQPDDPHVQLAGPLGQRPEVGRVDAELGRRPGGADVRVVPLAHAGVDAHEHLVAAPHVRPGVERGRVVERHPDALGERAGHLGARREVGRVEDLGRVEGGPQGADVGDLVPRDALRSEPLGGQRADHVRVAIGLDGVQVPVCADVGLQRAGPSAHGVEVVDVAGRLGVGEGEQGVAVDAPPGQVGHGGIGGTARKVRRARRRAGNRDATCPGVEADTRHITRCTHRTCPRSSVARLPDPLHPLMWTRSSPRRPFWRSLRSAFSLIWRTRSRVSSYSWPISSSVIGVSRPMPK